MEALETLDALDIMQIIGAILLIICSIVMLSISIGMLIRGSKPYGYDDEQMMNEQFVKRWMR